jgi:hypothetical protein
MRNYPATLVRVFENKLEDGVDTDEDISFDKTDLKRVTEELDIDVREVTEIASAYSSTRALPDEITEYGYNDIAHDGGDTYRYVTD